jgi:hypothetical protein
VAVGLIDQARELVQGRCLALFGVREVPQVLQHCFVELQLGFEDAHENLLLLVVHVLVDVREFE